jgi:hypothetical protein
MLSVLVDINQGANFNMEVFQMDNIQSYTTLTGLTLAQVAEKLDAELPKDAYTAVPGAAGLTDIDPNYMRKVLNETFGMCGIGWGYSYEPGDLVVSVEERKIKAGGVRRVHVASLKRLRLWYKLNGTAAIHICDVYASGGSDNDVEGYAMSGAITNAIGKAVSNLGFQESVYLGKRSHTTVGKKTALKAEAKKPAAPKPIAPALKVEAKASDEIVDDPAPTPLTVPIAQASSFVIPTGNRKGQVLGDQSLDVIAWYANSLKAANVDQQALQVAAKVLLKVRSNGHEPVAV